MYVHTVATSPKLGATKSMRTAVTQDAILYPFHSFRQNPHHDILHFQLRNLLCATSAFEFYYFSRHCIKRYNSLNGRSREVSPLGWRWGPS